MVGPAGIRRMAHRVVRRAGSLLRHRRKLAGGLVIAGLLLLLVGLARWLYPVLDGRPPYSYALGGYDELDEPLKEAAARGLKLQKGWVLVQGKHLAELWVGEARGKRALLRWRPHVDEPFLHLFPPLSELLELARALEKHAGEKPIFAWWDISLALDLLASGRLNLPLASPLYEPLFLPPTWPRPGALKAEKGLWGAEAEQGVRHRFDRFARALTAGGEQGLRSLCGLAKGGSFLLVLHVRDVVLSGALFPNALGIAFTRFHDTGDVHALVRQVHPWLEANRYVAYLPLRTEVEGIYVVALMDRASTRGLLVNLLPFVSPSFDPFLIVDGRRLTLVYQRGGFWVYEGGGACRP